MKKLLEVVTSRRKNLISGQALLVVLLSMSVVLAVVLSSVSKSVTDISITSYEEDALRAFSAAEAGIEQGLLNAVPGSSIPETDLDVADPANPRYEAKIDDPDVGSSFEYPDKLTSGQVATFWFVSHDNNGNLVCGGETCTVTSQLQFCWTSDSAVEIAIYFDNTGLSFGSPNNFTNLKVKRFNFDPKNTAERNFIGTSTSCNIGGNYDYSTGNYFYNLGSKVDGCVTSSPCLVAAKVRLLDKTEGQKVAIKTHQSSKLPSQGILVSSTGTSGDSTRKVTVLQGYPEPPDVFEGVLFSTGDIVQ